MHKKHNLHHRNNQPPTPITHSNNHYKTTMKMQAMNEREAIFDRKFSPNTVMIKKIVHDLYRPTQLGPVPLKVHQTHRKSPPRSHHNAQPEAFGHDQEEEVSCEMLRCLRRVDADPRRAPIVRRTGQTPQHTAAIAGQDSLGLAVTLQQRLGNEDHRNRNMTWQAQELHSRILAFKLSQDHEADEQKSLQLAKTLSRDDNAADDCKSLELVLRLLNQEEAEFCVQRLQREAEEQENTRLAEQLIAQEKYKESLSITLAMELEQRQLEQETLEEQSLRLATEISQEEQSRNNGWETYMTKEKILTSLESCQLAALLYVENKAQSMHDLALPALERRVQDLGFSGEALHRCLQYIRNDAPIIIHLTEFALNELVKDTHYRSLFETGTSGGSKQRSARRKWEDSMFDSAYKECENHMRPKYGCLNITGDIAGVHPARYYGSLFITLESHVRHRATFFDKDSGGKAKVRSLATNELYAHVLNNYTDEDLRSALSVSRIGGAPSHCNTYKEVQIHGPICLATDVQALSVPGKAKYASVTLKNNVTMFQTLTGCNVLWQGDLLDY
jgi:hypothetical protein